MAFLFGSTSDDLFEKATSENLPIGTEDLPTCLDIADKIKSKEIQPKQACASIKKRINHKNPNVSILALKLTDICIKNGGHHFLQEVSSRDFMDNLQSLARANVDPSVTEKVLELIQSCGIAFKSKPDLGYAVEVYEQLKREGFKFSSMEHSHSLPMLIETKTAPQWTDSNLCMRCRTEFTTFNRKHHCRNCGMTFCNDCSTKRLALPALGINDEVRVCDNCYNKLTTLKKPVEEVDDDLAKAIAASLELEQKKKKPQVRFEEKVDEDADLKRAIEESLKEQRKLEERTQHSKSKESSYPSSNYPSNESSYPTNSQSTYPTNSYPSNDYKADYPSASNQRQEYVEPVDELSADEIQNIRMFCELVEQSDRNVQQGGMQTFNPYQLQAMFASVSPLAPKLMNSLADAAARYKQLYDMNAEISVVVKDYDQLLQQRLMYSQGRYQPYGQTSQMPPQAHQMPYQSAQIPAQVPYQTGQPFPPQVQPTQPLQQGYAQQIPVQNAQIPNLGQPNVPLGHHSGPMNMQIPHGGPQSVHQAVGVPAAMGSQPLTVPPAMGVAQMTVPQQQYAPQQIQQQIPNQIPQQPGQPLQGQPLQGQVGGQYQLHTPLQPQQSQQPQEAPLIEL
ncbi:hypothetical protein EDD86DRAFT_207640 [Gorgonomyces haynaldii]|nr:hypothetical protein EDD86DRAFT_207640 [Gorgonomyces haynaldii]